jgi:biopolymer transport protein ExbB
MLVDAIANFLERIGAEWVLWLLAALSALSLFVMVERLLFFRRNRVDIDSLSRRTLEALRNGGEPAARKVIREVPGMPGGVLTAALDAYDDGVEAVEEVVTAAILRERARYDAWLGVLGTLGNNAPFIGLFGTVIGIIKAFADLASAVKGDERMNLVMGSLSEALVATAVGLAVAIPAVMAFNAFKAAIKRVAQHTEWMARNLLAHLKARVDERPSSRKEG